MIQNDVVKKMIFFLLNILYCFGYRNSLSRYTII